MRVLFVHGLESGPAGTKARYLAERFEALTPAMDVRDFPACVELVAGEVARHAPAVVVASSFGAAVALEVMRRGAWRGPTLLLAPAALLLDPEARLPEGAPVLVVHGRDDEVVPLEHARRLAATGTPGRVELLEVEDGHRLLQLVEGERLADLVRRAAAMA